ncbi:Leucine-rich repeat-containing protein 49 [Trebouxia sp. C0009 RCD-2024]
MAVTRPVTAWSGPLHTGFSSLPGGFAVHGQSVKQTQARASPLDSSMRSRRTPQPVNSYSKVSQDISENVAFKHSSSLDPCYKYVGVLRAVPRSNSMPAQQSAARTQSAASRVRPPSRSASRGRQDAPPAEPVPPKSSFKNLHFRQSRSGDVLIVSRTLTARMAAPHTLHLDHLKLSSCCLIEGEEQVTMLSYQHNNIQAISRLEQLPQLTILDMYSNNIQSLQGLPRMPALRGLMLGRNFISSIDSHQVLRSLEVLDLHSNLLESLNGVSALTNLRRLNLAGNRISQLCGLSTLTCLEDLNLSRNFIVSLKVQEASPCSDSKVATLPSSLRKLNLAANRLASLDDLEPLQQLTKLTQLGTEGNACCNLHPISRFRIEVLARHSANVQQIDSHKVGHSPLSRARMLHTGQSVF